MSFARETSPMRPALAPLLALVAACAPVRPTTDATAAAFDCLRDGGVLVSAHRAAAEPDGVENAVSAIRATTRAVPGAMLEIDVARTADGALVLMHDETIDRTTDATGRVAELTLAQIKTARLVGTDGRALDEAPPTLDEALAAIRQAGGVASLDFKAEDDAAYEALARDVVAAVRQAGLAGRAMLIATDLEQARRLHRLAPEMMLSVPIDTVADLDGIAPDRILAWTGTRTPDPGLWARLRDRGVEPIFGTLGRPGQRWDDRYAADGDPSEYGELARQGAAIIATDAPQAVAAALPEETDRAARCMAG